MGTRKKSVVFVCIGNACRSQIAEGWARSVASPQWEIFSAGSRPAGFVASLAIKVMEEVGIDISKHQSKGIDDLPSQEFDLLVTMGCGDRCPTLRSKNSLDWEIPDPIGESKEFFAEVRDLIGKKVTNLAQLFQA